MQYAGRVSEQKLLSGRERCGEHTTLPKVPRPDFCKLRLGPHKHGTGRSAGSRTLGPDVRYTDRAGPHAKRKLQFCGVKS